MFSRLRARRLLESDGVGDAEWSKLPNWAVVYFSFRGLRQSVTNAYALAPILIATLRADSLWVPASLLSAGLLVILGHSWLVVRRFEYQWSGSGLIVKQGIFQRAQLDLEFSRIQNVSVLRPFYFKPLGLVSLAIESAGSSEEEVTLAALDGALAESLRQRIAQARSESQGLHPEPDAPIDPLLIERSFRDLVLHGLSSNQAWLVLAGLLGVYSQLSQSLNIGAESILALMPESVLESTGAQIFLVGLLLFAIGLILMLGFSVLASLFIYANFQLHRVPEGFTVGHGTLSRRELTVRRRRIQTVVVQQNWIARFFCRFNVKFEQISHSQGGADGEQKLLVPAVTMTQSQGLVESALDFSQASIEAGSYGRVSALYLRKRLYWLTLIFFITVPVTVMNFSQWVLLVPSTVLAWLGWAAYRGWQILGVAVHQEHLILRSGLIGRSYVVVPLSKVQRVKTTQTPLMRRRRVVHLRLALASRVVTLPYLRVQTARQLADYILYLVEARPKSWM